MMTMLPRLRAEEGLEAVAAASTPHMEKRVRQRVVEGLQRQAGLVAKSQRRIDPATLAGMGMAVRYKKRPESASAESERPETPTAPEEAPGERQEGRER